MGIGLTGGRVLRIRGECCGLLGICVCGWNAGGGFGCLFVVLLGLVLAVAASGLGPRVRQAGAGGAVRGAGRVEAEGGVWVLVVVTGPGRMRAVCRPLADGG